MQAIIEKIEQYETIIIHRHERPDPDAIGSQAGLATLIRENYPEKKVYIVGEEEPSLAFLAEMDAVEDHVYDEALVLVCDTANEERISDQRYKNGKFIIKIDHHPNEEPYGDLMWVDRSFSSVSEMICELFAIDGSTFSPEAALLLYAGIVGDTGRFRHPNTTERTHHYAGKLVKTGIDRTQFYSKLHRKELKISRLEGYVLQHFNVHESGLAVMNITKEDLRKFDVNTNESSALVNVFADVEGVRAWVFFVEDEEGLIRVRLRSKGPHINTVAQKHNGGGHPLASGAKAFSWEETKEIIAELDDLCKQA